MTSTNFSDLVKISGERQGKDHAYLLNTAKLRKKLRWRDQTSLEEGLKKTLDWVDSKLNYLKKISAEYKHKV